MKRSLFGVLGLGLGLVALAVGYFYTYGQWQNLDAAKAELAVSETENVRLKEAQAQVSAFLAQYNRSQNEAQRAERALPVGDPDVALILGNVEEMATASGLFLNQLQVVESSGQIDEEDGSNIIKPIDFQAQLTGTYESFKDFALRLQNNLRLMDLVSVNVDASDEAEAGESSLQFILRLRAYYQE